MKTVSFYDPQTGLFTGRRFTGPGKYIARNTPDGCVAMEGVFDHLSQRVDLETGEVVDYQPPKPDDDHEWDEHRRQWRLKREIRRSLRQRAETLRSIEELERKQLRPARELAIDPENAEARQRLTEIEAQIAALRGELTPSGK